MYIRKCKVWQFGNIISIYKHFVFFVFFCFVFFSGSRVREGFCKIKYLSWIDSLKPSLQCSCMFILFSNDPQVRYFLLNNPHKWSHIMFVDATEHKFDGHYFAPCKFQYPLGIFYLYIYVYLITVLFIYFFFSALIGMNSNPFCTLVEVWSVCKLFMIKGSIFLKIDILLSKKGLMNWRMVLIQSCNAAPIAFKIAVSVSFLK